MHSTYKKERQKKEQLKVLNQWNNFIGPGDIEKLNILMNSCSESKHVETKFNIIVNAIAL